MRTELFPRWWNWWSLGYLATGLMQLCGSDGFGVSQPTVSRVITQTVEVLASPNIVCRSIKFVTPWAAVDRNVQQFEIISGFPYMLWVIGGTHVKIVAPVDKEPLLVSRHHYHSINLQVVCDANYSLLDFVAQWPAGSTSHSQILHQIVLKYGIVPQESHMYDDSVEATLAWHGC